MAKNIKCTEMKKNDVKLQTKASQTIIFFCSNIEFSKNLSKICS